MAGLGKGEAYSLAAAFTWGFAMVLFKRTGESVPPMALNLFKNTVGLVLIGATLWLIGDPLETLTRMSRREIAILLLSGVIGIAVADTIFFAALNRVGVGITSIVDCLYSPATIFFAWLLLQERLYVYHYAGAALIIVGILLTSQVEPPPDRTRGQIVAGVLLGALAVSLMAFGIVLTKPVLNREGASLLWCAGVRFLAGTAALAAFVIVTPQRSTLKLAFRPSPVWAWSLPAAVLASYVCYLFWMAGFKYAQAAIAAVLNQTAVIFAILLAAVILKEPLSARKLAALSLAVGGVLIITLGEQLRTWYVRLAG